MFVCSRSTAAYVVFSLFPCRSLCLSLSHSLSLSLSRHTLTLLPYTYTHRYVLGPDGSPLRTLRANSQPGSAAAAAAACGSGSGRDFLCAAVSPRGKIAYCVDENGAMHVFELSSGTHLHTVQVTTARPGGGGGGQVLGVVHHPGRNLVATYAEDGVVKLWRPTEV